MRRSAEPVEFGQRDAQLIQDPVEQWRSNLRNPRLPQHLRLPQLNGIWGGQGPNTRMNSSGAGLRFFAVPLLWTIARAPVVDQTGLTGVFDIGLAWDVTSPTETTDNLLSAAEQQLGIRIDRKKVQMEVGRAPTEN